MSSSGSSSACRCSSTKCVIGTMLTGAIFIGTGIGSMPIINTVVRLGVEDM